MLLYTSGLIKPMTHHEREPEIEIFTAAENEFSLFQLQIRRIKDKN